MGNWSKPLPAIKATTAEVEKVARSGAAASKSVGKKDDAPPKQRMAWYAYGTMLLGVVWAAAQELRSPTLTYGAVSASDIVVCGRACVSDCILGWDGSRGTGSSYSPCSPFAHHSLSYYF